MPDLASQTRVGEPSKIDAIAPVETEVVMVEDLLLPPGRYGRPSKIVVILRGPPGSGKSHLARLIKVGFVDPSTCSHVLNLSYFVGKRGGDWWFGSSNLINRRLLSHG